MPNALLFAFTFTSTNTHPCVFDQVKPNTNGTFWEKFFNNQPHKARWFPGPAQI